MFDTTELEQYLTILAKEIDNPNHFKSAENAARFAREVRTAYEHLGNLRKIAEKVNTALKEKVPEVFKESGVSSITVDGYRYVATETLRASVDKDNKLDAYQWLRDNELGDLIIETVNASTLSAAAKHRRTEGYDLDQDLFKVYMQPNLSITKS